MRKGRFLFLVVLLIGWAGVSWGQSEMASPDKSPVKAVQIFPNPAIDYVTVRLEVPHASRIKVTLHDIIGNIQHVELEEVSEYEIRLKVKDLATGYYFVSLKDPDLQEKATYKFLKR